MSCPFESSSRGFVRVSGRKNGGGASRAARWWGGGQQRERQEEEAEEMGGGRGALTCVLRPRRAARMGGAAPRDAPHVAPTPGAASGRERVGVPHKMLSCGAEHSFLQYTRVQGVCRCTNTHIRVVACTRERTHTPACRYGRSSARSHGCTDLCTHAHTQVQTHLHTSTYVHVHTWVCVAALAGLLSA